jgi:eukaryotic-like serine/threonine-protein kinase
VGRQVGRYFIHDAIASGGMATVHIGRMSGPMGFARTVAIKCLHSTFEQDGELSLMLLDEARLAARIQHPYVVPTLDVVAERGDLLVVMEYVHGESLAKLHRRSLARGQRVEPALAITLMVEVLQGLHAAHEVVDEAGHNLAVVHRDVSPQNVLVGVDGIARVLDFGVAKALGRVQTTREGQIKGKLAYMAPEQVQGGSVDRRTDVFAASIVLWELLVGERLFAADDEKSTIGKLLKCDIPAPSTRIELDVKLDAILLKGLAKDPSERFATALDMADALEAASPLVSAARIAAWVDSLSHDDLTARRLRVIEIESASSQRTSPVTVESSEPTRSAHTLSVEETAKRRRPSLWVVSLLLLLAGSAATYAFVRRPARTSVVTAAVTSASVEPASPIVALPPPTTPATSDSAVASRVSPPPAFATHHTTPAAPVASAKIDCSTPFVLDAEGHKHYRRECLHD